MAKKKKNEEISISELIRRSEPERVSINLTSPPRKKRNWLKWGLIAFAVLWVLSVLFPPKDKTITTPPPSAQVASIPSNTPRPSITPIIRETVTAEALASMVAFQTQNAPTQTQIAESVVIPATPSETDMPTETGVPTATGVPTDVPLPTATAITTNVAVIMVTNTTIPSATNTETPTATATMTNTAVPTQSSLREITDIGIVTGISVRVRSCASRECTELGVMNGGVTFPITGSVGDGESVEGNRLWYRITYQGQVGYVSATLTGLASAQNVSSPVNQSISPVQPTQPIVAPVSGWNCSGDRYNCPDFGSDGQFTCPQLFEYMSTCPSDPSRLDRDQDGRFCEAQCG